MLQAVLLSVLLWAKKTFYASDHSCQPPLFRERHPGRAGIWCDRNVSAPQRFQAADSNRRLDLGVLLHFVTLSTVGYGDIVPATPAARWFAMSLLVIGLGVFASAIASALGPKISGELNRLFTARAKRMELDHHVILVGEGAIARNTAEELKQRGVPFVQIVASKSGGDASEAGAEIITGDATSDTVLRKAGTKSPCD